MRSLMKWAFIGLLAIGATAYAGNGKGKHKTAKKAQTVQTCQPNCPKTQPCPSDCPPDCPPGCCTKKAA